MTVHDRTLTSRPSPEAFRRTMAAQGVVRFPAMLSPARLQTLRADAEAAYAVRRVVQVRNGVAAGQEGAAHHALGAGDSLDGFIADLPLWTEVEAHFAGKFILTSFGAALHLPGAGNYTLKPHRDVRVWTRDYPLSLNMLVMLDDFTAENGATLFLPGSQHVEALPENAFFQAHAEQAIGQAGDILLFDSLVVHAAAPNRSSAMRRALTLTFGRPFMKPQMDWPRFLPPAMEPTLTPRARQLLGYDARVAASLEEYYQPPERWVFKADQR